MNGKFQKRVQRYGWDKAADHYEQYWQSQLKPAQDKLLEMAQLRAGDQVLDTACGTGLVSFRAAEIVAEDGHVLGTDISERMVTMAADAAEERGIRTATFMRMDGEQMQLPDESFDVALCSLGLLYYPDPQLGLREMRRVLRPGGRAVAAVWGERRNCGWASIFSIVDERVESDVCPLFFQLGTGELLSMEFSSAGFTNVVRKRLSTVLRYDTPDAACGAAFAGGPVALAYARFDDTTKAEAHAAYLDSIERYRRGSGYEIPGEFVIVSGSRN